MNHLAEVRGLLADAPFDAILLWSEVNRRYATGFHSTAGAVYVSEKQAVFLTDFRYTEAARTQITDFTVCEMERGKTYSAYVRELLKADGISSIALEDARLTHADFLRFERALDVECCALKTRIETLRMQKDDEEIHCIVSAQRIAEQAFEEVLHDIREGVTEKEIAARLTYLMLHYGAENMSFDPIVVSGKNSSRPHGVPSEKTLASGDFITMDFGCIVNGYCSDMTRTVALGHVTERMKLVYDTVLNAQLAGIACAKAGVSGNEIDGAARAVIEKAGFGEAFGHGFGHSVGLEIHEEPNASPTYEGTIPAGAILTAEPGIYLPGEFGVRIEDMLYVIEDGCVNLTEAVKSLIIL